MLLYHFSFSYSYIVLFFLTKSKIDIFSKTKLNIIDIRLDERYDPHLEQTSFPDWCCTVENLASWHKFQNISLFCAH